jgi:ribonuclease P protein component
MITSAHRFKGHNSLRFVYTNGKTYRSQNFSIKVGLNQKRKSYRAAVVVSKKVSKLAVTRNKIRRRLYEAVRRMEDEITQPYDIVITVFDESVAVMPAGDLNAALKKLLAEATIIKQ